jgi:hypothetical protein
LNKLTSVLALPLHYRIGFLEEFSPTLLSAVYEIEEADACLSTRIGDALCIRSFALVVLARSLETIKRSAVPVDVD